jgi:hypothetical protein
VSVQPGYTFKSGSDIEVVVDGSTKFTFFAQGEHAWAKTSRDDANLIAAMRKGGAMTVRGISTRDTFSLDTYSLIGFTAAYNAMNEACRNARAAR